MAEFYFIALVKIGDTIKVTVTVPGNGMTRGS
jgi:acyl dehydratase